MNIKNFEFDIKEVTDEGIIEGYASTFGGKPDSYGDIIVEGAFTETLEKGGRNGTGIPLLWQHDFTEPIGSQELSQNRKGLKTRAELILEVQRAQESHALAKKGVINAFSIGWDFLRDTKGNIVEDAYEKDEKKNVMYLKKIELWEVSLVTFPANTNATITRVKTMFEEAETEKEIEDGLREAGLSHSAAKFILSNLDKNKLFERRRDFGQELLAVAKSLPNFKAMEIISIAKNLNTQIGGKQHE